jgi:type IV pilus assembly protein PilV
MNSPPHCIRARQRGMLLLQSLVALALFSVGALSVLMLSVSAMRQAAEAHYRTAASVLAVQMASQIRLGPRDPATLDAITTSTGYDVFREAAARALPGTTDYPPLVTVDSAGRFVITVRWQQPGDTLVHQYVALTRITE